MLDSFHPNKWLSPGPNGKLSLLVATRCHVARRHHSANSRAVPTRTLHGSFALSLPVSSSKHQFTSRGLFCRVNFRSNCQWPTATRKPKESEEKNHHFPSSLQACVEWSTVEHSNGDRSPPSRFCVNSQSSLARIFWVPPSALQVKMSQTSHGPLPSSETTSAEL